MEPPYVGRYDRIGTYSQHRFALELLATGFYCRTMKRISLLLAALLLCGISKVQADDAATEERLNQLSGKIEDLIAGQEAQRKQLSELRREIDSLREQASSPPVTSRRRRI